MSRHREDWKQFYVLSGDMAVMDVSDKDRFTLTRLVKGDWAAFAEYDDDNVIRHIVVGTSDLMNSVESSCVSNGSYNSRFHALSEELECDSGIVCIVDAPFVGKRHIKGFEPNGGWIPKMLEAWGDPLAEDKSDAKSFAEIACHLAADPITGKSAMRSDEHGAFFSVPSKSKLEITVLFDEHDGSIHGMEGFVKTPKAEVSK